MALCLVLLSQHCVRPCLATCRLQLDLYVYDSNAVSHPEVVLNALRGFYSEGLFTDIALQCSSGNFPYCHKVALCARSSYFRVMFTADMTERTNSRVRYVLVCERRGEEGVIMDGLCQLKKLERLYSMPHCHLQAISLDPPCASVSA